LLLTEPAWPAPRYVVTDLEAFSPSNGGVRNLNEWGHCIGLGLGGTPPAYRAFLFQDGRMMLLSLEAGQETHASGLNDRGQVVGWGRQSATGQFVPFFYEAGVFTPLSGVNALPMAINNRGVVVGALSNQVNGRVAFVWEAGHVQSLGTFGYAESAAMDINDQGEVVGLAQTVDPGIPSLLGGAPQPEIQQRAFRWFQGTATLLGAPGGPNTVAMAVNRHGQIAGSVQQGDGTFRAFLYAEGVMTNLGGAVRHSQAYDVNDRGEVVGYANFEAHLSSTHGFVYQDGRLSDLNHLIDPQLGLEIMTADTINNAGQIGGSAWKNGRWHAVLLTPTNAELVALEVTQTVQDWAHSVPLVQGKDTVVRAHVQATAAGAVAVSGRLRGFDGLGQELPESPLAPLNPNGRVTAPDNAVAARTNFAAALNFLLPDRWTRDRVRLEMMWLGSGVVCGSNALATGVGSDCSRQVEFVAVAAPRLRWVEVQWTNQGALHLSPPDAVADLPLRLRAVFPVAEIQSSFRSMLWLKPGQPNLAEVNTALLTWRALDLFTAAGDPALLYYGAVAGRSVGDDIGGLAAGIPGDVSSGLLPGQPFVEGRHTHSHEIGHSLGRHHPTALAFGPCLDGAGQPVAGTQAGACGECADAGAPFFPFFRRAGGNWRATLGPTNGVNSRVFGCDTLNLATPGYGPIIDPDGDSEMMSYCSRRPVDLWISSHTYTNLLEAVNQRFATTTNGRLRAAAGPQDVLIVRGIVQPPGGPVALLPWLALRASVSPPAIAPGPYALRLLDAAQTLVREIPFAPVEFHARGDEPGTAAFVLPVSLDPDVHQVVVAHQGQPVASRTRSSHAPTVTLLAPNGDEVITRDLLPVQWHAADADQDALSFTVQFSPDDGGQWLTLVADVTGTQCQVDVTRLPGTPQGRLRVVASDGWRSASDASDRPFTIPNRKPFISLVSPRPGAVFLGIQQVHCVASVWDAEDGSLSSTNLTWVSNREGLLGTGSALQFEASTLAEGTHLLTLIATDSAGATNAATVTLDIQAQPTPELSVERLQGQVRLSWPAWPTGFELESSITLAGTNAWIQVGEAPHLQDGQNVLTNVVGGGSRFFRLIRR
jgi:probable HAF family extracellular repeat protein